MVITLAGIITITFFLTKMRPDPITAQSLSQDGLATASASQKAIEEQKKRWGYDQPLYIQYFKVWKLIVTFDFGKSRVDEREVMDKIKEALPITLALNIITIFIVYIISVPLGVYSALNESSLTDRVLTFSLYVLYSLPSFWIALMLLKYLAGGDHLDLFPIGGLTSDHHEQLSWYYQIMDYGWHLFLPIVVSVYGAFAFLSRFVKNTFIETWKSDFIRTARAKGLSKRRVIFIHALRNSLIPLVTLMAGLLPELFGGSVIIESIFSIPGMGKLAYDSIYINDDTVIIAITSIAAFLTLFGILLSDFIYTMVDPRIRLEKEEQSK